MSLEESYQAVERAAIFTAHSEVQYVVVLQVFAKVVQLLGIVGCGLVDFGVPGSQGLEGLGSRALGTASFGFSDRRNCLIKFGYSHNYYLPFHNK